MVPSRSGTALCRRRGDQLTGRLRRPGPGELTVRAWVFDGEQLELREQRGPALEPGAVRLQVDAVGLCHSDTTLMGRQPHEHPFDLPLVLGHEIAGTVTEMAPGAAEQNAGLAVGDPVVVYGPWGCGACRVCLGGRENHCPHAGEGGILPPGLGAPGGLAEQVVIPAARHLVRADGIATSQAAPLADAGLTAYSAVRQVEHACVSGSVAVIIGIGGLGHVAVQVLKALTPVRVVAVDVSPGARELAADLGADLVIDPSERDAAADMRAFTGGRNAEVVLDFVAGEQTLPLAARMLTRGGHLSVVGVGTATLPVGVKAVPLGATVRTSYWGTRQELVEVLALAREGQLRVNVQEYAMSQVPDAYAALAAGQLVGRAVVRPERET